MARAKYVINEVDFPAAWAYVSRKCALNPYWLEEWEATQSFQQLKRDPVTLTHWCERWLDPLQWQQLKAALRAARKRQRQYTGAGQPPVHVSLSVTAWRILSDLAKRDAVTLSQFIINQHQQAWLEMDVPELDSF